MWRWVWMSSISFECQTELIDDVLIFCLLHLFLFGCISAFTYSLQIWHMWGISCVWFLYHLPFKSLNQLTCVKSISMVDDMCNEYIMFLDTICSIMVIQEELCRIVNYITMDILLQEPWALSHLLNLIFKRLYCKRTMYLSSAQTEFIATIPIKKYLIILITTKTIYKQCAKH